MMGPASLFTIPVALGIIEKDDRHFLARESCHGLVTVPVAVSSGEFSCQVCLFGTLVVNLVDYHCLSALIFLRIAFGA